MYFTMGRTIYFLVEETKEAHKVYKGVSKSEAKSMCEIHNRQLQRYLREKQNMSEEQRREQDSYYRDMAQLFAAIRF